MKMGKLSADMCMPFGAVTMENDMLLWVELLKYWLRAERTFLSPPRGDWI